MKNLVNLGVAAALILFVSITFISCAAGGQALKSVIADPNKGAGSGDSSGGGTPKYIVTCHLNYCVLSPLTNYKTSADGIKPTIEVRFMAARRIRKNTKFLLEVVVDSASCPRCKF
jgi:hypothetical protein